MRVAVPVAPSFSLLRTVLFYKYPGLSVSPLMTVSIVCSLGLVKNRADIRYSALRLLEHGCIHLHISVG